MLNDGDKAVCYDGNMNLYPDCILALPPKAFDSKMLLDSYKEKHDLPTAVIKQGNVLGEKVEVIGVVYKRGSRV